MPIKIYQVPSTVSGSGNKRAKVSPSPQVVYSLSKLKLYCCWLLVQEGELNTCKTLEVMVKRVRNYKSKIKDMSEKWHSQHKISTISDREHTRKNWLITQIKGCYNLKYVIERVPTQEGVDLQEATEGFHMQSRLIPKRTRVRKRLKTGISWRSELWHSSWTLSLKERNSCIQNIKLNKLGKIGHPRAKPSNFWHPLTPKIKPTSWQPCLGIQNSQLAPLLVHS